MLVSWVHLNCCIGKSAGYLCVDAFVGCMRAFGVMVLRQSQAAFHQFCVCMAHQTLPFDHVLVFGKKRMLSHGRENFVRITYSLPTIFFSLACFPPGQKLIPKMECGELGQKSWFTGFLWAINLSENSEKIFFCRFTVLKQSINHHVYLLFIHCSIASKTDFKRIAQWTSQLIVEFFISCSYFIATNLHVFAFMWKERKK